MSRTDTRLLTITQLAELLQVPVGTLYRWRSRCEGPPGIRMGRHLRYSADDVARWLEEAASADRSTRDRA
jgi:excisionase family DNA binding protein